MIEILYEDSQIVAINKPPRLSFHREMETPGVAELTQNMLQTQLWPVHRLDKMTSGVLLFAKSKASAESLNALFRDRQIKKTYLALGDAKPKKKQGKILGDMVKARNGSWKLTQNRDNPAITRFYSCTLIPGVRFFWLKPQTGKTHQLRVACKSLGAPILGDSRYSGTKADRGYLHAFKLEFIWNNKQLKIECYPKDGQYFQLPQLTQCIEKFEQAETEKD